MGIINGLEDYNIFTNKLNIDILRDSEPNLIFHFIQTLSEKETDLMRRAYYAEVKKAPMDWRPNENHFALNRLMKQGMLKSYIDEHGKGYKFTRHGKKIAKVLVEDYFPYETYPTQQRNITIGRIYRDYMIKTYFNRRPITSNSIPSEKIGSYDFQTQLIEFTDINFPENEEIGRMKSIEYKDNKITKTLKEKIEKGLKLFDNPKNTRVMRPILYNRRLDQIIFMVAFGGQSLYITVSNVYVAYLRHRYGEDIKFLVNTNHLNRVLSMGETNPPLPIMAVNEIGEPVSLLANEAFLIKETKEVKEIVNNFYRSYDFGDE